MRIRHLLTMSTGHSSDVVDGFRLGESGLVRAFLSCPSNMCPARPVQPLLVHAVRHSQADRQTLADHLKPRLLDPLGIDADWELTAEGISNGGYGLSMDRRHSQVRPVVPQQGRMAGSAPPTRGMGESGDFQTGV